MSIVESIGAQKTVGSISVSGDSILSTGNRLGIYSMDLHLKLAQPFRGCVAYCHGLVGISMSLDGCLLSKLDEKSWTNCSIDRLLNCRNTLYAIHSNGSISKVGQKTLQKVFDVSGTLLDIGMDAASILVAIQLKKKVLLVKLDTLTDSVETLIPSGTKNANVSLVSIDPSLSVLAFVVDNSLYSWDIATNSQKRTIPLTQDVTFIHLLNQDWCLTQQSGTVSLWDLKFGTRQFHEPLQITTQIVSAFTLKSTEYGDVLLLAQLDTETASIVSGPKKMRGPGTDTPLVLNMHPFHLPSLTLVDVIGKRPSAFSEQVQKEPLVEPVATILSTLSLDDSSSRLAQWIESNQSLEMSDLESITLLISLSKPEKMRGYMKAFGAWILSKTGTESKFTSIKESKLEGLKTLSDILPSIPLAQPCVAGLCDAIFTTKFWPRSVVEYLLTNGHLSESLCSNKLMSTLMEKKDWELISKALEHVSDIKESSLVALLEMVCNLNPIISNVKYDLSLHEQHHTYLTSTTPLTPGQLVFFYKVFSYSHSLKKALVKELRALSIDHLIVLMSWISGMMIPPPVKSEVDGELNAQHRHYLWWLHATSEDVKLSQWTITLEALTILLDAHGSTLHFVDEVKPLLEAFSMFTTRSVQLFESYHFNLNEPLTQLLKPVEEKVEKKHGRRFKSLMDQVHDGVGEYAVQLVQF